MAGGYDALQARVAALRLHIEIAKAGNWDDDKHPRYPKGDPLGGKFAPSDGGSLSGWFANFFGGKKDATSVTDLGDPLWNEYNQPQEPFYSKPRRGSIPHPSEDDKGNPVYIFRPTEGTSASSPAWKSPGSVVTVVPGGDTPKYLNGIKLEAAPPAENWETVAGQNPQIEQGLPDLENVKGMHPAAGVIIQESDGRIWLTKPLNGFGGYKQTFPKGTQEHGLTLQQTAIKEAWEETGLKVELTGVLGDFKRTTSMARYYIARRVGGSPSAQGWESQAMRLVPPELVTSFLNMPVDREIWHGYVGEHKLTKLRAAFIDPGALAQLQARMDRLTASPSDLIASIRKDFDEAKHPRWPKGSPLGGQFMSSDASGITLPPKVGSASNPTMTKKAEQAYQAAKDGNIAKLQEIKASLQPSVDKYGYSAEAHSKGGAAGAYDAGPHSQAKWTQGTHQYVQHLIDEQKSASLANLTADGPVKEGASVPDLGEYKKVEAKPGGSNPGAVYDGPDGNKYLVKGANYPSDDRAKNEVLSAKLMQAAGVKAPDMHLVDLGKEYGGGLGVASKMEPMTKWTGTPSQVKAAQGEFAVHAWLANYDSAGTPAGDNLAFAGGKVFNYDPGGALLYRAQGLPKKFPGGELPTDVSEWNSMRDKSINPAAASIYGKMTGTDLANAAEKLKSVDDKTISDLVAKYGPGTPEQKLKLAATLIKRRDNILSYAGIDGSMVAKPGPGAAVPEAKVASNELGPIEPNYDQMKVYDATSAVQPPSELKHAAHMPAVKNYVTNLKLAAQTPGYANALAKVDALQAEIALNPSPSLVNAPPGTVSALNTYGSSLKGAVKVTQAGSAPATPASGTKPTKASLKATAAHADAAINQLQPDQMWAKEALQAKMAISHAVETKNPAGLQQASDLMGGSHWLNAVGNGSYVDQAHEALGKYHTEASAYLAAHPAKETAKWGPGNPPKASDFKAGESVGNKDQVLSSWEGASKPMTAAYKDGDVNHLKVLVTQYAHAKPNTSTTPGVPEAVAHNNRVMTSYGNALLVDKGEKPVAYEGSNYQAANEARHEAAQGKFGPGNAPGDGDFYTMAEHDKVVIGAGAHQDVDKLTAMHTAGDKAGLQAAFNEYDEKAKTGIADSIVGSGKKDLKLNEAGMKNSAIKAQYAKALLDDLRGKPAAPSGMPDFTALGDTYGSWAETATKINAMKVGSDEWNNEKQFFGEKASHPGVYQEHQKLIYDWMQAKEAGSPAALGSAAHDAAEHAKPAATTVTHDSGAGAEPSTVAKPEAPPPIPNFQHTTKTAKAYYEGLAQKAQDAYGTGDVKALADAMVKKQPDGTWKPVWPVGADGKTPKTMNGKLLQGYTSDLMVKMTNQQVAIDHAELAKPVGAIPSPGENKGSNPAMPEFDRKMIPTTNTNAASHNAKVFQIKTLAQKGDVKGLLALNYGTNTYGKKQAALANDALAALGSPYKVVAGQKKNTHFALTSTGNEQPVTSTTTGKPISAALTDKELPAKIDFANYNTPGKGLSSKPAVNAANQQAFDKLIELGKAGDVKGIKNATFQPINPETGDPVGKPLPISEHPSQHIKNTQITLLQTMDEKLHPPEPLKFFAGKSFKDVQEVSNKVPPAPYGTTAAKHPSSQTIGYFLAIGQVQDPTNLVPTKTFNLPPEVKSKAAADYSKMSYDAKQFVSSMQSSGGKQFAHAKPSLEPMMVAAHKYASELPAGTTLYKWDNLTPDMKQKLSLAQPGLIIQNPAPVCTSYNPTSTKGFGSSHRFKIIAGPGAKVISSFASGSFSGEGELSLLPNNRLMVLGHKKNTGDGWSETTVMLLPPDPALEAKAKKLH